jgi:hypothetical protein
MNPSDLLAEQFEESRSHLRAVAYRMLGSTTEADDAVQEAWLRLSRSDTSDVDNLAGWLTTVVSRLDPEVVLRADAAAVAAGAEAEVRGALAVAGTFSGRARVAKTALIDGIPGGVWAQDGKPRVVFAFTISDGKITGIELLAEPERLDQLELKIL